MVRVFSTDNCFPEALLAGTLKPLTLVLSPSAKGRGDKDFRSASFTKRGAINEHCYGQALETEYTGLVSALE
jgi:hypothetical protein